MDDVSMLVANRSASVSPGWHYGVGVFSLLCLLCGSLTNGFVIFVYVKNSSLRRPRNFLLINLTMTDLGLLLANTSLHAIASFNKGWPFGQTGCNLYAFFGGLCAFVSIATMAAIALTRLVAVIDPLSSLKLTAHFTLRCIACTWLYALVWMVAPFFGLNRFVFEGSGTSCTFDYVSTDLRSRLFIGMLMIGGFVIPLTIIVVSYSFILVKLSNRGRHPENPQIPTERSRMQVNKSNMYSFLAPNSVNGDVVQHKVKTLLKLNTSKQSKKVIRQTEIRVARTALLVCGIYCLAWTPYALMTVLSQVGYTRWLNVYTTSLVGLFTKLSACVNPLIYALSSSIFRRRIYYCLQCFCRTRRDKSFPLQSSSYSPNRKHLNANINRGSTVLYYSA